MTAVCKSGLTRLCKCVYDVPQCQLCLQRSTYILYIILIESYSSDRRYSGIVGEIGYEEQC